MKLDELKAKVYELSEVTTIGQLKAKYEDIKTLDMRRKISWEKALTVVRQQQDEFQNWLENPPEEYQDLFAEIEAVSHEYQQKLIETEKFGKEVIALASSLEELAKECQAEADCLKQEVEVARRTKKQAELN